MTTLRQIVALSLVVLRHFARSAVIAGKAPKIGGLGQTSGVLLRVLFVVLLTNAFYGVGHHAAELHEGRLEATAWLVVGVSLYVIGTSLAADAPQVPGGRYPLRSTMLHELPITSVARVAFILLRQTLLVPMQIAVLAGAGDAVDRGGAAMGVAIGLGLLLFVATGLTGIAFGTMLRALVPPHRLSKLAWIGSLLAIAGVMITLYAPLLAQNTIVFAPSPTSPLGAIAGAVEGTLSTWRAIAFLVVDIAIASVVVFAAERIGFDRLDAAPPDRPKRLAEVVTVDVVERVLAARELGGRALVVVLGLVVIASAYGAWTLRQWLARGAEAKKAIEGISIGLGAVVAQVGSSIAMTRAGRAVFRDAQARPFLAPLPLPPRETLRGKVRALRQAVLPLALVAVPWAIFGVGAARIAFAWRSAAIAIALVVLCEAAVPVAFLTNGLGAPGVRSAGAPLSLASFLLFLPLLDAAVARSPYDAAISLLALAAIGLEANRAAQKCVEWIDDADDAHARDTEVWRALIVLAAFYAVQTLTARLLAFFAGSRGFVVAAAYAISAVALVLMTASSVPLRSIPVRPKRLFFLPLGVVLGTCTALLGLGYRELLRVVGAEIPDGPAIDAVSGAALVVAVGFFAPLSEELFFRGWLQAAFARELPEKARKWSFAVAAFAFAAAHPPMSFVPVLALGLAAGGLYAWSGGIAAGVLAHATHNALVMLLAK